MCGKVDGRSGSGSFGFHFSRFAKQHPSPLGFRRLSWLRFDSVQALWLNLGLFWQRYAPCDFASRQANCLTATLTCQYVFFDQAYGQEITFYRFHLWTSIQKYVVSHNPLAVRQHILLTDTVCLLSTEQQPVNLWTHGRRRQGCAVHGESRVSQISLSLHRLM